MTSAISKIRAAVRALLDKLIALAAAPINRLQAKLEKLALLRARPRLFSFVLTAHFPMLIALELWLLPDFGDSLEGRALEGTRWIAILGTATAWLYAWRSARRRWNWIERPRPRRA